jgi:mannitol/fructose-specific phosphotransferase system IIA component (Ntr-type)
MEITDYLRPDRIALNIQAHAKADAIKATAAQLAGASEMSDLDGFVREVFEREELGSTAMGYGIAIPHARSRKADSIVVAVGRLVTPVAFDEDLGRDVRLIFLMGTPHRAVSDYLKLVAGLARRVKHAEVADCLMTVSEPQAFIDCLRGGGRG